MTGAARALIAALLVVAGCAAEPEDEPELCAAPADGGAACTALAAGDAVLVLAIASAVPPGIQTGGVIFECGYELVQVDLYTGPGGQSGSTGVTARGAMYLAAGEYERVAVVSAEERTRGSFVAGDGGTVGLAMQQVCPEERLAHASYGADGTSTLRVIEAGGIGGLFGVTVFTYQARP
jgi:hypothetical protein